MSINSSNEDAPNGFDNRITERNDRVRILSLNNVKPDYVHQGSLPNTPCTVSVISFVLGSGFAVSLATLAWSGNTWWHLSFFLASWCLFHWAEFAVTAGWNEEKCTVDSFLLENGSLYHIAHGVALAEYITTMNFYSNFKVYTNLSLIGIVLVVVGQILRSSAMIHASTNFSHSVAYRKVETHKLVTDGVYRWFRHPSYTGFYYWALGTQIVLQNPVSFVLYAVLLWRFFSRRIRSEEAALVKFFGEDYVRYRAAVGTKIPFVA